MFFGPKAMSLYTVSSNSWCSGYWNTIPTLKRTCRISLGFSQISRPSSSTRPEVGRTSPLRCCTSVDLPDPVCPMMPMNSPGWTVRDTSRMAAFSKGVPAE